MPYRHIGPFSETDPNLIDDFSSEAPVVDFPQPELERLEASFDIDCNGVGVLTMAQPRECICCGHRVTWARGHQEQMDGDVTLTCPECLHPLGLLEEN